MPNKIKYTTTPTANTIKVGNFALGVVTGVTYAPTSTTSFYNGYNVPSGGYVVYQNKATLGPSVFAPTGNTQMVNLTKSLGNMTATTIYDSLKWINSQSTIIAVNREYENIVTSGLTMSLDAGFTPSYPLSGTSWTDLSFGGNNGTLVNGPSYSSSNGGTIVFDGTNDYVNGSAISSQLTGDITVEAWIYITSGPSDWVRIIGTGSNPSGNRTFGLWYDINRRLLWQRYGATDPSIYPANVLSYNTWYYVAATTSGSSNALYLNGSSIGTSTAAGPWPASNENITIGSAVGIHAFLTGNISIARIYNRGLSSTEILQNYNVQSSRLPPSLAGSLVFNGSNQSLGLSPGITFGAGAFTVEGWFYNNSNFNNKGILGSPVTSPTGCMNLHFSNNTVLQSDKNGGGGAFTFTMASAISINAWHYLIYNRNSNGVTAAYIDGVRCTATSTDTLNYNTATDTIGRDYAGYWPGYWTNMRITIGNAVYDSSQLTQSTPTTPLTSLPNTKYLMLGAAVTTDSSGVQTVTNNNTVTQNSSLKPF
jgi:hypothetical protein